MDVITTLTFFDRWRAHHHTTCGIAVVETSMEHDPLEATTITLRCRVRGNSICGSVRDIEISQVMQP